MHKHKEMLQHFFDSIIWDRKLRIESIPPLSYDDQCVVSTTFEPELLRDIIKKTDGFSSFYRDEFAEGSIDSSIFYYDEFSKRKTLEFEIASKGKILLNPIGLHQYDYTGESHPDVTVTTRNGLMNQLLDLFVILGKNTDKLNPKCISSWLILEEELSKPYHALQVIKYNPFLLSIIIKDKFYEFLRAGSPFSVDAAISFGEFSKFNKGITREKVSRNVDSSKKLYEKLFLALACMYPKVFKELLLSSSNKELDSKVMITHISNLNGEIVNESQLSKFAKLAKFYTIA